MVRDSKGYRHFVKQRTLRLHTCSDAFLPLIIKLSCYHGIGSANIPVDSLVNYEKNSIL